MKMTWKILLMVAVLIWPVLEGTAQTRQRGAERQHTQVRRQIDGTRLLDLTEEQQSKMKDLRMDMQKRILPLQNKIGEYDAKLQTLASVEQADLKAINKVIDSKMEASAKVMKIKAENHQKIRSILTEEQRIVFDSRGFDYAKRTRVGQLYRTEMKREYKRSYRE